MQAAAESRIDYRLLSKLSRAVLCSPCFRRGVARPVPQLLARGRKPRNVCSRCRAGEVTGQ